MISSTSVEHETGVGIIGEAAKGAIAGSEDLGEVGAAVLAGRFECYHCRRVRIIVLPLPQMLSLLQLKTRRAGFSDSERMTVVALDVLNSPLSHAEDLSLYVTSGRRDRMKKTRVLCKGSDSELWHCWRERKRVSNASPGRSVIGVDSPDLIFIAGRVCNYSFHGSLACPRAVAQVNGKVRGSFIHSYLSHQAPLQKRRHSLQAIYASGNMFESETTQ